MVNVFSFIQPFTTHASFIHTFVHWSQMLPSMCRLGHQDWYRALSIQSALQFFYAQPHILTAGAIWGSASRPRTLQYASWMSRGSNHRPSYLWMTSSCTSWVTAAPSRLKLHLLHHQQKYRIYENLYICCLLMFNCRARDDYVIEKFSSCFHITHTSYIFDWLVATKLVVMFLLPACAST